MLKSSTNVSKHHLAYLNTRSGLKETTSPGHGGQHVSILSDHAVIAAFGPDLYDWDIEEGHNQE
jgi:hypothetical protein